MLFVLLLNDTSLTILLAEHEESAVSRGYYFAELALTVLIFIVSSLAVTLTGGHKDRRDVETESFATLAAIGRALGGVLLVMAGLEVVFLLGSFIARLGA